MPALLSVPVTAESPVSPAPVTLTVLIVPLAAVTVMPLAGFAPWLPLAGVMVSWTALALADCDPLPDVPPEPPPEPDWQAAASRPAAPKRDERQ